MLGESYELMLFIWIYTICEMVYMHLYACVAYINIKQTLLIKTYLILWLLLLLMKLNCSYISGTNHVANRTDDVIMLFSTNISAEIQRLIYA